jgi:hypothetical protein
VCLLVLLPSIQISDQGCDPRVTEQPVLPDASDADAGIEGGASVGAGTGASAGEETGALPGASSRASRACAARPRDRRRGPPRRWTDGRLDDSFDRDADALASEAAGGVTFVEGAGLAGAEGATGTGAALGVGNTARGG